MDVYDGNDEFTCIACCLIASGGMDDKSSACFDELELTANSWGNSSR